MRKFVFVIKELIDVVMISPMLIYPVDKPICNESTRNEEINPRIELIEPVFNVFVLIRPEFEIEPAFSVVILAEPAPRLLVLIIALFEKAPVLVRPPVVVTPAFNVVI